MWGALAEGGPVAGAPPPEAMLHVWTKMNEVHLVSMGVLCNKKARSVQLQRLSTITTSYLEWYATNYIGKTY
jgi:hypothetical protein